MLADELLVDQADRRRLEVHHPEVEQGHPELLGGRPGDVAAGGHALLDEIADEGDAVLEGLVEGIAGPVLGEQAVLHETSGQAVERQLGAGGRHSTPSSAVVALVF